MHWIQSSIVKKPGQLPLSAVGLTVKLTSVPARGDAAQAQLYRNESATVLSSELV